MPAPVVRERERKPADVHAAPATEVVRHVRLRLPGTQVLPVCGARCCGEREEESRVESGRESRGQSKRGRGRNNTVTACQSARAGRRACRQRRQRRRAHGGGAGAGSEDSADGARGRGQLVMACGGSVEGGDCAIRPHVARPIPALRPACPIGRPSAHRPRPRPTTLILISGPRPRASHAPSTFSAQSELCCR